MPPIKIMTIFGTRPEAIKLAPVIKLLQADKEHFSCIVAVTAQHRAMLDQMLEVFRIKPDVDLDIMEHDQSLFQITQKTILRLEKVLQQYEPDLILVQGDTTSTFIGALAGFYRKTKVAHLEAGLRTRQKFSPYPEEINRRLTSVLADLHFSPTQHAKQNLLAEGAQQENIFVTGNTVVDAVLSIIKDSRPSKTPLLEKLLTNQLRTIVITAHRRENWGQAFESIAEAVLQLASQHPDVQFVFPMHLSPQVRKIFQTRLKDHRHIHLLEPLDYASFIKLLGRSHLILSDSGGVQEEAPTLRKPVLVMREVTERPEGLASGCLKLVGCRVENIVGEAQRLLNDPVYYQNATRGTNPYGDGQASQRTIAAIKYFYGLSAERPADFSGIA